MMLAYINGKFIPEQEAAIGISDLAIRRGFGIFDFFRTVGRTPLFIDDHISRFYISAEQVELPVSIPKDKLREVCLQLIEKNNINDSGIRMVLTGGYSSNSYTPEGSNLIITNEPVKVVIDEVRHQGVKVITHDYQREFPEVKTINYFTGIMMQRKASKLGAFDVLYHNNGLLREFTRSNIFIVDETGDLYTPTNKILKGVTRKYVMELAKKDFNVTEKDLTMNDLFKAKEVFITGTTKKVLPVIQIDDHIVGNGEPGKITSTLINRFNQLEHDYITANSKTNLSR